MSVHGVSARFKRPMRSGQPVEWISQMTVCTPANRDYLLGLLSKRLGVPKSALAIIGGETGRQKRLRVEGLDEATVRARLLGDIR